MPSMLVVPISAKGRDEGPCAEGLGCVGSTGLRGRGRDRRDSHHADGFGGGRRQPHPPWPGGAGSGMAQAECEPASRPDGHLHSPFPRSRAERGRRRRWGGGAGPDLPALGNLTRTTVPAGGGGSRHGGTVVFGLAGLPTGGPGLGRVSVPAPIACPGAAASPSQPSNGQTAWPASSRPRRVRALLELRGDAQRLRLVHTGQRGRPGAAGRVTEPPSFLAARPAARARPTAARRAAGCGS